MATVLGTRNGGRSRRGLRWFFGVGALFFVFGAFVGDARAVPVFARKYKTACGTCHTSFPKLTPFGEAFRRTGYRFPGDTEDDTRKDEPVPLGQAVHKKVFPKAVWPNELPATAPLAAAIQSSAVYAPSGDPKVNFSNIGGGTTFNLAATLGDVFSVWSGVRIMAMSQSAGNGGEKVEASIERVFATIKFFERPVLLLRVGRFEPQVLSFSSHRMIGPAPWMLNSQVGDNQWSLEGRGQLGLEASGVFGGGRVTYSLGFVEGAGNQLNTPKDVYARVAFKVGGLRLDGVTGGAKGGATTGGDPWSETSVQVGGFVYYGMATVGDPTLQTQSDQFVYGGADANFTWRDLNFVVAFAQAKNWRPIVATPSLAVKSWHIYAQADWVAWPWFIPSLRWERRKMGLGATEDQVATMLTFLVRANVRAQALTVLGYTSGGHVELNQVAASLGIAF